MLTGWPDHVNKDLLVYFTKHDELSTEQECMLWGSRFIIPSTYHQVILGELHAEHSGISQTSAFEEATSGGMELMQLS